MRATTLVGVLAAVVAVGVAPPSPYEDECIVGKKNMYTKELLKPIPEYTINLDLPPEQRWVELATKYKYHITELIQVIKSFTMPLFHGKLIDYVDAHLGGWDKKIPEPFHSEMMGIANATGLKLGEIVMYNLFYELKSACTSIVARGADGKLYHGRNMDFGMFLGWNVSTHEWILTQRLIDVNVNINFMRNGKLLAKETTFVGYLGAFNGMKPNAFTVTMNTRFDFKHGGMFKIAEWLLGLTSKDTMFTTFAARHLLENATTFQEAKTALMTMQLMGPGFYILAGMKPDEGAVLARGPNRLVEIVELGNNSPDDWYVLQTNYDPSKNPLYLDDRRTPGHHCMDTLSQKNVSFEGLYNVLSSKTNLNKQTILTVLMQPDSGKFETYTRDCPDPCWPF